MARALEASGALRNPEVRKAFLAEPRERYVPEIAERDGLEAVYRPDVALVTARDRTGGALSSSSAPAVMAPMLEALELRPSMRVLEVGAGTGYNAALIKRLVGEKGGVVSVEVDPGIARQARRHLAEGGHKARVVVGDGRDGWPAGAPFDRIIATASSDFVPLAWRDQLAEGGLVVLPFRFGGDPGTQAILGLRRDGDVLSSTTVFLGFFMPLRAPGVTASPVAAQPLLTASTTSGARASTLARLSGRPIELLSEAGRRRLLAGALLPGRRLGTVAASGTPGLLMFLLLHPGSEVVRCTLGGRFGAGVIGPLGRSFAALTWSVGKPGRIETWGDAGAQDKLGVLVEEWRRAGRPALGALDVTVNYNSAKRRAGDAWRRWDTPEGTVSLYWRRR
ncbi:MAG TPA: methyltransferase domain-containing protein [Acidimicrobiales bacterium]|nr:methyltransferase domain-containing protein [Acidimicrobiales bacterium]